VRISEPAADLSVMLAITSSLRGRALPRGFIAFGEVGLAGEVRGVQAAKRRLAEAARLGYRRAIVPGGSLDPTSGRASGTIVTDEGMQVTEVDDVWTALALAFATAGADA
jgi:DNA repair protein RadA/Sms